MGPRWPVSIALFCAGASSCLLVTDFDGLELETEAAASGASGGAGGDASAASSASASMGSSEATGGMAGSTGAAGGGGGCSSDPECGTCRRCETGACVDDTDGAACSDPTCTSGVLTPAGSCVSGACKVPPTSSCPTGACDGDACGDAVPNGQPCASDVECVSTFCEGSICCNEVCAAQPPETCGATGGCSTGTCPKHPSGTLCSAAFCAGGMATAARTCDGAGTCSAPVVTPCGNYQCATTACAASCTAATQAADCIVSAVCVGGQCVPPLANGQPCSSASVCASGFCVDGVCCAEACGELCRACTAAKKGSGGDGACGFVKSFSDPDAECSGCTTCNGSGTCALEGLCGVAGATCCTYTPDCHQCVYMVSCPGMTPNTCI